ncbi:hypothetical protein BJX70DRAFT_66425 [Aspergillus crustosus]
MQLYSHSCHLSLSFSRPLSTQTPSTLPAHKNPPPSNIPIIQHIHGKSPPVSLNTLRIPRPKHKPPQMRQRLQQFIHTIQNPSRQIQTPGNSVST